MIPYSILDLSPIPEGATARDALRNTRELAQHAEGWGYTRFWLAEHHNMPGIASAATAVVIGYVAEGTRTLRVGSGGVMLPNHAPLVIAEQFGTLAALYPGRIDLGLGRAPGTDAATLRALRRDPANAERFPEDVIELLRYFSPERGQRINAVPGAGLDVPIWLLGSSLYSARLAAALGLPFAFASHFAPDALMDALTEYRGAFQPSRQRPKAYAMACVNVFAADTDAEAHRQFSSLQQAFLQLRRGKPGQVPPPVDNIDTRWSPMERDGVGHALKYSFVGAADTVRRGVEAFLAKTQPDELMVTGLFHDHAARLRSFELAAQILGAV
jgi:luciferase family oxidoreductase group 1